MDVSMAVCIAVTLGQLSQVATGDHIAPWREPLSCSMPGAVSASLCAAPLPSVLAPLWATTTLYGDTKWIAARVRDGRVQQSTSFPMAMPPTAAKATKPPDGVVCGTEDFN